MRYKGTGKLAKWALCLAEFSFDIKMLPGKKNSAADALSRLSCALAQEQRVQLAGTEELRQKQREDPLLSRVIERIRGRHSRDVDVTAFLSAQGTYSVSNKNGLLMFSNRSGIARIVLPAAVRYTFFRHFHLLTAHGGRDRTASLIGKKFYWPGMYVDVEKFVKGCHACQITKKPTENYGKMVLFPATRVWECL